MRAIKLNDEIDFEKKKQKESYNTDKNLIQLDFRSPKNNAKKHQSAKLARKRTISPRKSRKKEKRTIIEENSIEEEKKGKHKKNAKKMKEKISNNSSSISSKDDDVGSKK